MNTSGSCMAEWDAFTERFLYMVSLVGCDVFPRVMVEEYRCPWKYPVVIGDRKRRTVLAEADGVSRL